MKFRMIDLETASLRTDATIWQFGYCDYQLIHRTAGIEFKYEAHGEFFMRKELLGTTSDNDTLEWMRKVGTAPLFEKWRRNVNNQEISLPLTAWDQIHAFLSQGDADGRMICANWASFDLGLLKRHFELLGKPAPWHHRNQICLGSIRNTANMMFPLKHEKAEDRAYAAAREWVNMALTFEPGHNMSHMTGYDSAVQARWHVELLRLIQK